MKSLLLITGAGASYDVIHKDADHFTERPPLTKDLFNSDYILKLNGMDGERAISFYLQNNPIAAHVGYEYVRQPEGNKKTLERYLFDLLHHKNNDMNCQYWAVPLYLQDLFFGISNLYLNTGLAYNYKSLIDRINISGKFDQLLWLNLNYDLFADQALGKTVVNNNIFNNLDEYMQLATKSGLKIKYTKPHGSVDWFYRVNNEYDIFALRRNGFPVNFQKIIDTKVTIVKGVSGASIGGFYPAISAPIGEYKYIYEPHIEEIKKDLGSIESILCVGFSALDGDILTLIKDIPNFRNKLMNNTRIVNGSKAESMSAYQRLLNMCSGICIDNSAYDGGFSSFVKDAIADWLNEQ